MGRRRRVDDPPGAVGVVERDLTGKARRGWSQVFLEDDAVLVDHERHHAGIAPPGGEGDQGEAARHATVYDVAVCAGQRVRSLAVGALAVENAEIVALER